MIDGKEQLIKAVKRLDGALIACGILIALLGGLLCLGSMPTDSIPETTWGLLIFGLLTVFGGVALLVLAIKNNSHPETSTFLRKNKHAFEQVEELFRNKIYEDNNIIMSNKHIANKHNLIQIAALEDIYVMYLHKTTYNFVITVGKEIYLETPYNRLTLSIYLQKKEDVENLVNNIASKAPNVRLGYNADNLAYLNQKKAEWKAKNA